MHGRGEAKGFTPVTVGKPTSPQGRYAPRGGVRKGPESRSCDPKPGDLGGGRVKPGESPVEARKGSDVQFVPLTSA